MELLSRPYSIHSMSGREKKIKRFIKRHVLSVCPDAEIDTDLSGNMYITRGKSETYPCIVAHLDQVQNKHSDDFQVVMGEDIVCAFSPSHKMQQGLGADDKNGIWIALKCLEKYDTIKVAFFVSEEIGCIGSSNAVMGFFDDCRFVVEPDRRGSSDLITEISWTQLCSEEFLQDIGYEAYGYKPTNGLMTDVLTLKENGLGVSCINMSCGYYEPHTNNEFTSIPDLMNALHFVEHIIETCTKVYPHEYTYTGKAYIPKCNAWDDYYTSLLDVANMAGRKSKREVTPPKLSDYGDAEDLIYDLVWLYPDISADELWDYVSSDLETVGMGYSEFCEYVDLYRTY